MSFKGHVYTTEPVLAKLYLHSYAGIGPPPPQNVIAAYTKRRISPAGIIIPSSQITSAMVTDALFCQHSCVYPGDSGGFEPGVRAGPQEELSRIVCLQSALVTDCRSHCGFKKYFKLNISSFLIGFEVFVSKLPVTEGNILQYPE